MKLIALLLTALTLACVCPRRGSGLVYYVDKTNGDNGHPGTIRQPWQSFQPSKISPGDKILFKRGEEWNTPLVIPHSNITVGAYPDDPSMAKPRFNGLVSAQSQSLYWFTRPSTDGLDIICFLSEDAQTLAAPPDVDQRFAFQVAALNSNAGMRRLNTLDIGTISTDPELLEPYTFARSRGTVAVRLPKNVDPDALLLPRIVWRPYQLGAIRDWSSAGVVIAGKANVSISELDVCGWGTVAFSNGIAILDCMDTTILRCEVSFCPIGIGTVQGPRGGGAPIAFKSVCARIEDNEVHDNSEAGIYMRGPSSYNRIVGNRVYDNYNLGGESDSGYSDSLAIGVSNDSSTPSVGNVIERNHVFNNGRYYKRSLKTVFDLQGEPHLIERPHDPAIALYNSTGAAVRYNRIFANRSGAFAAQGAGAKRSDHVIFSFNYIADNYVQNGPLVFVSQASHNVIQNNTFRTNTMLIDEDAVLQYYTGWGLLAINGPANNTFVLNNVFDQNLVVSNWQPSAPQATPSTGQACLMADFTTNPLLVDHNAYHANQGWLWVESSPTSGQCHSFEDARLGNPAGEKYDLAGLYTDYAPTRFKTILLSLPGTPFPGALNQADFGLDGVNAGSVSSRDINGNSINAIAPGVGCGIP